MAQNNVILAGALLLVLLSAYGITFTEERLLSKADHKIDESGLNHVTNAKISSSRNTNLNRGVLEDASAANVNTTGYTTDDFRPTTPGHSPGAGH
ncbi:hypothetical protein DITRI_Ditri03aG0197000 [Diplodiscus trichospermus]